MAYAALLRTALLVTKISRSVSVRLCGAQNIKISFFTIAECSALQHQEQLDPSELSLQVSWSTMSSSENLHSPRKRAKLFPDGQMLTSAKPVDLSAETSSTVLSQERSAHATKEVEVGITDYVSPETSGFRGLLKKRYTDFIVNEILPNGQIVHLRKVGQAMTSQTDEDIRLAVLPEQNETDMLSQGASGSASIPSLPVSTLEAPSHNDKILEKLNGEEADVDKSGVSSRNPRLIWKVDIWTRSPFRILRSY